MSTPRSSPLPLLPSSPSPSSPPSSPSAPSSPAANQEQQWALDGWARGENVCLQAPPGTGKTWTLLQAAHLARQPGAKLLVLAYNTELAADVEAQLCTEGLDDVAICATFHGLCTRAIGLAADDAALERCIRGARDRTLPVTDLSDVTHVLIDEAQDLNALHVELLRVLLPRGTPSRQYFVAGDRHQMLYDYGEHPSSLGFLDNLSSNFPSGRDWWSHQLVESRRITARMARLVDAHFETGLRSSQPLRPSETSVHVHGASKWDLGPLVARILEGHRDDGVLVERMALLAATKAGNVPLRAALNHLSASGTPLHVHGIDGAHDSIRAGKLRVSTWHAAKGTECDVAIVLLPRHAKRNPLYVALTRARAHLHLLITRDEADLALCRTLARLADDDHRTVALENAPARAIVAKASLMPESAQAAQETAERATTPRRNLSLDGGLRDAPVHRFTRAAPAVRVDAPLSVAAPLAATTIASQGRAEGVADVYVRAVLCRLEHAATGRVRAVEDCLSPARVAYDAQDRAIRLGHQGRLVTPAVSDASLLAHDLRATAAEAYRGAAAPADWCTMAAAVVAWNAYHHRMRQLLPVSAWVCDDTFEAAVATATAALHGTAPRFDVRLLAQLTASGAVAVGALPSGLGAHSTVHVRAHAVAQDGAWHVVWEAATSGDRDEAALRAAVHPARVCRLLSLATGEVIAVHAADGLLTTIAQARGMALD